MKTKINKEIWKASSVNYLNSLASNVNELREKAARLSALFVGKDLNLIVSDGKCQAETDYQKALERFYGEYARILLEWNEINKKEVE